MNIFLFAHENILWLLILLGLQQCISNEYHNIVFKVKQENIIIFDRAMIHFQINVLAVLQIS